LLNVERVGRHDSFFELGGHSLLAVRVNARIRQLLNIEVAISDLFAYPRLSDLAARLAGGARAKLPAIKHVDRRERLPLSFAQQRLWFLAQMAGVSEAYHIPVALRLKGDLNSRALRQALDRVVARHEVLRTTFVLGDGEPVQRIAPLVASHFHLLEHDLREDQDAQIKLQRLGEQEAVASFDLEHGPLIRGRLIRLGEEEHVLLVTMHHIVSDGWSMGVMLNELSTLYGAYLDGKDDPLPELAVQYVDYAVWQRQWIEGEVLREQGDYWKKALASAPALLEVPTDRPRPEQQNYAGDFLILEFDEQLAAGLKELSRRRGTTLYMTLLAGWAVLMARLSGQQDVVIGTPVANRGRAEIENLIGFFVNTQALRVNVAGSPRVSELLERVREQAVAAQQHQDIPFEQVVELVRPHRSLAHTPLFQVMFAWQNAPMGEHELASLQASPLEWAPYRVAKFDLMLSLQEVGDKIVGGIEYSTALFDKGTVERYLEYFRRLLKEMATDDAQAVDRLPILGEREQRQVLYDWNNTEAELGSDKCVHELFEEQVRKTPEAVAVVYQGTAVTYRELNRRANRLAHYLRRMGVKPDVHVAIGVERSVEMVVALLAVLKAGGAYVPLDPASPSERLQWILKDSVPAALLTQGRIEEQIPRIRETVPVVNFAEDGSAWSDQPEKDLDSASVGLTPKHLAYMIYTSGSTGKPKGVEMQHRALVNLLRWQISQSGSSTAQRTLQFAAVGFDVSFQEIFSTLCCGGDLVLIDDETRLNPRELVRFIQANQIQRLFVPYVALQMIADELTNLETEKSQPIDSPLSQIITAGEQLRLNHKLVRLFERVAGCELQNQYGPTETHVVSSYSLAKDTSCWKNLPPIGRPIANTQIYILDSYLEPVPVGVVGELYLGGMQVARGYLNRPDLTAERFLADPFGEEEGARIYRTGDLGRWQPDGTIEFLGRNDFQVKVRGFRIELGEIESVLEKLPHVRQAAVVAREDHAGEKRLVAYFVPEDTDTVKTTQIREELKQVLPEYMVPSLLVPLNAMPLSPNGKIDRRALPAPDQQSKAPGSEYSAPQGAVEIEIARIWEQILRVGRVGAQDDFFELGGHSLLAIRVMSRITQSFAVQLPVAVLFQASTLREFAQAVEAAQKRPAASLPLALLRKGGPRPPLYLIGADPDFAYRALLNNLPEERTFYGLQTAFLADGVEPDNSIEQIAQRYVAAMLQADSKGPYYLAGHSLAGLIAFEMAQQLTRQNKEVAFLGILDMALDMPKLPPDADEASVLAYLFGEQFGTTAEHFRRLSTDDQIEHIVGAARKLGRLPSDIRREDILRYIKLWKANQNALSSYEPKPYGGRIALFRAVEKLPFRYYSADPTMGWSRISASLQVIDVPGNHYTLLNEPSAREVARSLSGCIDEAELNGKCTDDMTSASSCV
jgi:amino acid adenylation domain-containing protein